MIKCAVCDDDYIEADILCDKLKSITDVDIQVDLFLNPKDLIQAVKDCKKYDCIFMDIELDDKNGIDIITSLSVSEETKVIFVSNYDKYVLDSFVAHPYYYIVKPVDADKLSLLMHEICADINNDSMVVSIIGNKKVLVKNKDILYIKSFDSKKKVLLLSTVEENYMLNGEISEWDKMLDSNLFLCPRRGYIVNLLHIHVLSKYYCILDNGKQIPVSRSKFKDFESAYVDTISNYKL